MKKDTQDLEQQLHDQQAVELDEALLDRLESAAEGTLTKLTEEEVKFEAELRAIQPEGLSKPLLNTLETVVQDIPAPTQVHVLPFPQSKEANQDRQPRAHTHRKTPTWAAAAAAVALLGVISAWWLDPMNGSTSVTAGQNSPDDVTPPENVVPATAPAEFTRNLTHTQDQGIIWGENKEPHRVIKVTYTDRVSMTKQDGSTYEVEKPRVEYYLVPTESQ